MIILSIVMTIFTTTFVVNNSEFLDTANKEINEGATWHYIGKQSLDPTAKSITLQMSDEEPYILFKLKKEK